MVSDKFDEFGQQAERDNRASPRSSVMFMAQLSAKSGAPLGQVRVRNISRDGLLAETGLPLHLNDEIQIDLRGVGAVSGRIVRRTPNQIAIKFDVPIDPMLTRNRV